MSINVKYYTYMHMYLPRLPGFQPKHHYEAISALTMSDARSVIKVQTIIALTHCVATTITNKTYFSAWKSWLRVAEIFHYPVSLSNHILSNQCNYRNC
jgi:hypothetical protein